MITRKQYMANSSELFHDYYSQFITESSTNYIKSSFTLEQLKASTDGHLNDVCKMSNGGAGNWTWDFTPMNIELAREAGEISERGMPSDSCKTCVGKSAARNWMAESNK